MVFEAAWQLVGMKKRPPLVVNMHLTNSEMDWFHPPHAYIIRRVVMGWRVKIDKTCISVVLQTVGEHKKT